MEEEDGDDNNDEDDDFVSAVVVDNEGGEGAVISIAVKSARLLSCGIPCTINCSISIRLARKMSLFITSRACLRCSRDKNLAWLVSSENSNDNPNRRSLQSS